MSLFAFYRDELSGARLEARIWQLRPFLASALEAALLAMVECFSQEVAAFANRSSARELSRPRSEWGLSQLLLVARNLGWLPSNRRGKRQVETGAAQVGDYVEVVRVIRNLIHPAIYLREYPGEAITEKHLDISYKVLEVACECLSDRLDVALRAAKARPKKHESRATSEY